jgi:arabinan endo-1,5-alpha-L-arabinosidase
MGEIFDPHTQSGNAMEPFYIHTSSGKGYLFWGSYIGVYGRELADDLKTLIGDEFKIAGNGFEGEYILEKDGKFFFFGSSGTCCRGKRSTYHLTIGAATNIRGPYFRKDGTAILPDHVEGTMFCHPDAQTGWVGTGHNGEVIKDDLGRWFIIYHAIYYYNDFFPEKKQLSGNTRRPIMMDEVFWDEDGWPYIEDSVPSTSEKWAPYFKDMEHETSAFDNELKK